MSELRVPTITTAAEVSCADGRVFSGRVYVPAAALRHSGPMRVEEWINDPAPFFPFLPDGEEAPVLLNKDEVVAIAVAAPVDAEDATVGESEVRRVTIECGALQFEGELHIDMPEGHRRVLDTLNQPSRFVTLWAGDRRVLVHKPHVIRIVEKRGA